MLAQARESGLQRGVKRRRVKPRMVVVHGGKELEKEAGSELLLSLSQRMDARRLQRRLERINKRHEHSPERRSVAIAMLAVEEQLVKALWVIARQPLGKVAPLRPNRCGLEYMPDVIDIYAEAIAKGGWQTPAPRPALPSAKEITAANRVHEWLLLIDDERLRKLLVVGATNKRGDAGRQVQWERVREHLPEWGGYTVRSLKAGYQDALRTIVARLTTARVG